MCIFKILKKLKFRLRIIKTIDKVRQFFIEYILYIYTEVKKGFNKMNQTSVNLIKFLNSKNKTKVNDILFDNVVDINIKKVS